ncbi:MAG: FapA family protein [Treponema sp.]|jgi:uncharacterized protein (DUF342 family)|nr:FapA family protein [Treponema sp.]
MVDFVQLQNLMKEQLDADRAIRTVDVEGSSLDDAVAEAAVMLNLPLGRIEYEIVERGFPGFLGTGKKVWKIKAYGRLVTKKLADILVAAKAEAEAEVEVIKDKDGDVFVLLNDDGANLKVIAPKGAGKKITEADAMKALQARDAMDIDVNLVRMVVKEAKGIYIRVADFNRKYSNDSIASVNITDQDMKAFISVMPPGIGGADMGVETIIQLLKDNKVVHGIKQDFLQDFVDRPAYKMPVLVAEGTPPTNGRNAYIHYNFKTDPGRPQLKTGSDGRVDFKESNTIQNVVKDQPLGKKVPAEEGVMGKTVKGEFLPAKNGQDLDLTQLIGNNVRIGEDKVTILASSAGQVVLAGNKINVEPIYTVQGNVNLKTGNITFLGSVIVTGNVEDGFSVKATGNIEIKGTVEKAEIEAEGNIVILKGVSGKNMGTIKSGKSVYARFIENAKIEAGNMVIVTEGIINSQVDAYKRIVCQGKRARIVGGRYRASEEINAKTIGSAASNTETLCEVGIDPASKKQLDELFERKTVVEKNLEEAKLNFQTLNNILQQRKSLPEDKEVQMQQVMEQHKALTLDLKQVREEIDRIQETLSAIKTRGRVSVSDKIYPGVKVIIRDQMEDVKVEYKATTFILENDLIKGVKYEEPDEEAKRPPPEIG